MPLVFRTQNLFAKESSHRSKLRLPPAWRQWKAGTTKPWKVVDPNRDHAAVGWAQFSAVACAPASSSLPCPVCVWKTSLPGGWHHSDCPCWLGCALELSVSVPQGHSHALEKNGMKGSQWAAKGTKLSGVLRGLSTALQWARKCVQLPVPVPSYSCQKHIPSNEVGGME